MGNDEKVLALIETHIKEWLERKVELLGDGPLVPFVENIHPEREIVRLHLWPYLAAKGDLGRLLVAYTKSASNVKRNLDTMSAWWDIFQRASAKGGEFESRFDVRNIALIACTRKLENWPASQHSPAYETAYKPTYHVLTLPEAQALLQQQKLPFSVS